jgi:hypothetical protein
VDRNSKSPFSLAFVTIEIQYFMVYFAERKSAREGEKLFSEGKLMPLFHFGNNEMFIVHLMVEKSCAV